MNDKFYIAVCGTPKSGKTTLSQNLQAAFDKNKSNSVSVTKCSSPLTLKDQDILKKASAILVSSTIDQDALINTQSFLTQLYTLAPKEIIYTVLNRYDIKSKINPKAIKDQLNCNILGAIPMDQAVTASQQKNMSFIEAYPNSIATKYVTQIREVIETKKILQKGQRIQNIHQQTQTLIPLKATGTGHAQAHVTPQEGEKKLGAQNKHRKLKMNILQQLTSELNLKKLDTETGSDPKKNALLRQKTKQAIQSIMERERIYIGSQTETRQFIKEILDEALGLGALESLLADDSVTEIMVNKKDQIYIEKNGKIQLADMSFTSDRQLLGIIERIVAPLGRRIDEKTPYVDARLADGSRVHAIIPPLSLEGPVLTIRKFSKTPFVVNDLIKFGTLTAEMADFIRACTESRQNIVISGGTGTGKTTMLNVLSSYIPSKERIITVEDSAELRLKQPHVCRLESRPPNIEGQGSITIRDLVRNTLRMRPDRIIVGECRDGAALDMLQAMNTGHDGSMTTVHANTPRDCLSRLETLVMMAGMDLPSRAIREQISSAVNLIIQISRFSDGSRKITHISEVTGMEKDTITLQDIMVFKQEGLDAKGKVVGEYKYTGNVPKFVQALDQKGLRVPKGFITQGLLKRRRKSDSESEES